MAHQASATLRKQSAPRPTGRLMDAAFLESRILASLHQQGVEFQGNMSTKSRVENRRSGVSLPVAADEAFASSPQSGLAWLCFRFPLIEPDRRISRIRRSEKTHDRPCDSACNF